MGVRCEVCVCLCVWGVGVVIDVEETGRLTSLYTLRGSDWICSEELTAALFIPPQNFYMTNSGLVQGIIGGYYARWCQRLKRDRF